MTMPVHELPNNPSLFCWRGASYLSKVHIALRDSRVSLCGITVPQTAHRPEETGMVCSRCENSLKQRGMLGRGKG